MASYQDGSPLEFCLGHKREQSQDSGAYIDWNSEDSASPVNNPDCNTNDDFITVVSVDTSESEATKNAPSSFVTVLAIGESGDEMGKLAQNDKEEEVLLYRLPGERLGFGLKFEGGTNTVENVKRLFIQSSAPDSPASRAKCSWGSLVEGDEILKIDGHVVKDMTRLDCVRCLKESSVVIKLYVRHKTQKTNLQLNRIKLENTTEIRVNNNSSLSPTVVSAEMKKAIPPPPPVPPRKIARKSPVPAFKEEPTVVTPPEEFCDLQNLHNPIPKARNIQLVGEETSKNLSKFVIKVPQKVGHDSPDSSKRIIKRTGSDLKLVPPEPKIFLDLLAQEESRNCESESDDTGSTISTVVGLSVSNTTNSSFSDLRSSASSFCDSTNPSTPTSEPTTPVLDLSRMLSPYEYGDNNEFLFTKLINGKDHDLMSYDEKITNCADDIAPLQPPLSFQDAPLSYGNEEMRANLSENMEFMDDVFINSKNQETIVSEPNPSSDGKAKESSISAILSKKPSLIPRLAKSIGLLSPPKPSPRKESATNGNKSRFTKKKPPPLPPAGNAIQNAQSDFVEGKTLKSSIPYLKKKKVKSDDAKKNSKSDRKPESSNIVDECSTKKSELLPNETMNETHEIEDIKKEQDLPELSENNGKLTWEVPDIKNSKGSNALEKMKNNFEEDKICEVPTLETSGFFLNLESDEFKGKVDGGCESHFLFPWGSSKQLETIGEDEEELSAEDISERCSKSEKKKNEKLNIEVVEEITDNSNLKEESGTSETKSTFNDDRQIDAEESQTEFQMEAEVQLENCHCPTNNALSYEEEETEKCMDKGKIIKQENFEEKEDESEANGPKHKSALCNNHVLVKLNNDSLEVVKNVNLNSSNGELKEVMVPVVSTTIGLAPTPNLNRMPPDGHEFPQTCPEQNLTSGPMTATRQEEPHFEPPEGVLPPLPASEPPTTSSAKRSLLFDKESDVFSDKKCSTGRTNRDLALSKPARNSFWRQDEKSEKSVRDKIAMFSSAADSSEGSGKLSKYKSSDDVFCCDEADCTRNFRNGKCFSQSILSLDKVSNGASSFIKKSSFGVSATSPRSLDYTNRTQSSMDLSSSSSAYSSSCSPDSSLSSNSSYLGFSSTLPRKKTRDDDKSDFSKRDSGVQRATSFSIHGRSQSLLDVNPSPFKARYLSESLQDDNSKPGSLNMLIEQRRKNLSKLRGLVIPEKLSDTVPSQPIVDLPEIKSRDLILNSKVPNAFKERNKSSPKLGQTAVLEHNSGSKLTPTHLWDQSKAPNIPKYSPAFKRKSISVFGAKEPLYFKNEIQSCLQEPLKAPIKPPRNLNASRLSIEDPKYQDSVNSSDGESYLSEKGQRLGESPRAIDMYVPKRKSTPLGKYRLLTDSGRSEEDSDNDSAVSSSRSSISHGFSPPASPLLDNQYQGVDDSGHRTNLLLSSPERSPLIRTLSSDTTVSTVSNTSTLTPGSQASLSNSDASSNEANNKRILKPQSVEAINRKNVLTSAKYSRGFDLKSGSPLIQRKFSGEDCDKQELSVAEAFDNSNNHCPEKKYSVGSNSSLSKSETVSRSPIEKIAYITEVTNVSTASGKKKLEKSESLPSEPTSSQPSAPRKTSVPFGFAWDKRENFTKANYTPVCLKNSRDVSAEVFSTDKPTNTSLSLDKDLEPFSRTKSTKSLPETDPSLSSINLSNEPVDEKRKNTIFEPKGAQINNEKVGTGGRRSISVNDIRKAFEKIEGGTSNSSRMGNTKNGTLAGGHFGVNGNHVRVSSLDSTTSEDNCALSQGLFSNLQREQFGSITSLASSTSLISPQELQLLIEEANQTLEESGTNTGGASPNNHDVLVIILHRDTVGGSVGITLAGGADYESKEITVHKVLSGSPADRDGRLQKGDRILSINGKSMKGVTHRESLAILKSPRLEVVLVVSRLKTDATADPISADDATPVAVRHSLLSGSSRPPRILEGAALGESGKSKGAEILREPPVTLNLIKDGAGLGFSLEGGKDCPAGDRPLVVKKIFTGGAAEKCGQLKAGDELVNVNGIDVSVMSRIEVWKLMKQLPDGSVTVTVRHRAESRPLVPH